MVTQLGMPDPNILYQSQVSPVDLAIPHGAHQFVMMNFIKRFLVYKAKQFVRIYLQKCIL